MEDVPVLQMDQERTADIGRAECFDADRLVFVGFSFFNIGSVFGLCTMAFQNIFGENVPDVGTCFFPRQYFTVEVVGVKVSGQYIEFTRSLQEVVMYDSPVMFSFRRIFVIIDDDGHTFCFDGKTAMINIIQCHELIIFTVAILRILVGVGKKNQ